MKHMSLTGLRGQLFKIVDQVIDTGVPVELERKGHKVKIVLVEGKSKLENLKPHECIVGNPDDLVDAEVAEWHEQHNL